MSEDIYSQYLRFALTESGASTFTEGDAILTGSSPHRVGGQNIALEIHAIGVDLSFPADNPSAYGNESVTVALATRSGLTTMPNIDEEHCVYKNGLYNRAGVGTYLPMNVNRHRFMPSYVQFKHPLLISHPKIYPYILSTNSAAAATGRGYLLFTYVLLDQGMAIEALEAFR